MRLTLDFWFEQIREWLSHLLNRGSLREIYLLGRKLSSVNTAELEQMHVLFFFLVTYQKSFLSCPPPKKKIKDFQIFKYNF